MNRWNKKRRKWLLHHSKKKLYLLTKNNKRNRRRVTNKSSYIDNYNNQEVIRLIAPEIFSLTQNAEETMKFFSDFIDIINRKIYNTHFFIDSKKVKMVTVDALIYLIAIMQNHKLNKVMKYEFAGNFPENEDARRIYTDSGFTNYVQSRMKQLPPSTEKMQILSGTMNDADIAKSVCLFVMDKLGKSKREVNLLYSTLIELLSNVYHHAYLDDGIMQKKWYIHAEHIDDTVQFIFVDTGQGIAATVRKNWGEKLFYKVGIGVKDSDLLKSTFNGDFRTKTKETYRGNGLNTVKNCVFRGPFKRFEVVSGRGKCCFITNEAEKNCIRTNNYENKLYGTLYTFVIS